MSRSGAARENKLMTKSIPKGASRIIILSLIRTTEGYVLLDLNYSRVSLPEGRVEKKVLWMASSAFCKSLLRTMK